MDVAEFRQIGLAPVEKGARGAALCRCDNLHKILLWHIKNRTKYDLASRIYGIKWLRTKAYFYSLNLKKPAKKNLKSAIFSTILRRGSIC
jgi:hypothetical protein